MKRILWLGGLLPLLLPSGSEGALITPSSAFASTYYNSSLSPTQAINNSGLDTSSGDVLTYTHDARADGMFTWITGQGQGGGGSTPPPTASQYIVFDLGANYDLSEAYLWQLVQGNQVDRGLKDFRLLASPYAPTTSVPPANYDLTGFVEILPATSLNIGSPNTRAVTQAFTLTGADNVRQIYLDVISTHNGLANSYVGISEIKFEGTLTTNPAHYWSNAAGGEWQTASNWTPDVTPTSNSDVFFTLDETYTTEVLANAAVNNLTIASGDVTIDVSGASLQARTLTVSGGKLKMSHLIGGASSTGPFTYAEALNWTNGIIEIHGGLLAPIGKSYNAGNSFPRAFAVSGTAGSSDRPELQLTGASTYFAAPGGSSSDGAILIGVLGGRGRAIVAENSQLTTPIGQGQFVVGASGAVISQEWRPADGILNIVSGGNAGGSGGVFIGFSGGLGEATVEHAGSRLTSTNPLYIGYGVGGTSSTPFASQGSLSLSDEGGAQGAAVYVGVNGAVGRLTVDGAGTELKATHPSGTLSVGYQTSSSRGLTANGTLEVTRGGQVKSANSMLVGVGFQSVGHVTVDGAGSSLTNAGALQLGSDGAGTMQVTNGGLVSIGADVQIGGNSGSGSIIVGESDGSDLGGSRLEAVNLHLTLDDSLATQLAVYSGGHIALSGELSSTPDIGSPTPALGIHGGTLQVAGASVTRAESLNWTHGDFWLDGGSALFGGAADALTVPNNGVLKGSGVLKNRVNIQGTVSPGDGTETAILQFQEDVTIGTADSVGTLVADLNFSTSTADVLGVFKGINLTNAKLSLLFDTDALGAIPLHTSFILIDNQGLDEVIGTFAEVDLGLLAGLQYMIDYNYAGVAVNGVGTGNDVAITFTAAVPEPSAVIMLLMATGMMASWRQWRQRCL